MGWEHAASAIGAINIVILGFIVNRLARMDEKLDQKQDVQDCERVRRVCLEHLKQEDDRVCKATEEIWDAFSKHSHTGLDPNSKVTR